MGQRNQHAAATIYHHIIMVAWFRSYTAQPIGIEVSYTYVIKRGEGL